MATQQARFEVHALPLAAIDAVMQICRHIKDDAPYRGVNILLVVHQKSMWARVDYVNREWCLTIRFLRDMLGYHATKAIFHKPPKDLFFRLERGGPHSGYQMIQQEKPPFAYHPFSRVINTRSRRSNRSTVVSSIF